MKKMRRATILIATIAALCCSRTLGAEQPLKIYILARQFG
jgi:hypothetical protein